jgi:hypothetical protein
MEWRVVRDAQPGSGNSPLTIHLPSGGAPTGCSNAADLDKFLLSGFSLRSLTTGYFLPPAPPRACEQGFPQEQPLGKLLSMCLWENVRMKEGVEDW